ncbi:DNA polymerase III subunit epsilon [bacterium]|jgi:DNA polymerase III subunit epsilon|nr:DNA polymerase III subunit epsilon [bacterium]
MLKALKHSKDGETILLKRFHGDIPTHPRNENAELVRASYVDLETTGLDPAIHKIIEIGILTFEFDSRNGQIVEIISEYESFQDPGGPVPPEITKLTGISTEMVQGEKIAWEKVYRIFEDSSLILAHNAIFDRGFLDPILEVSKEKIWGCSMSQVPWRREGCSCASLPHLCMEHGFFYTPHRALTDVKAAVNLLGFESDLNGHPYLETLNRNAQEPEVLIRAFKAPFETKDLLKERRFRWNVGMKVWEKRTDLEEASELKTWMIESIYAGKDPNPAKFFEVPPEDRFKKNLSLDELAQTAFQL